MTNLKGDHFEESEWVVIEIRNYKDKGQNLHFISSKEVKSVSENVKGE